MRNGFRTLVRQLSDCDVAVDEAFLHGLLTGCATVPATKAAGLLSALGRGQSLPDDVRESVFDVLDQVETELSNETFQARFDAGSSGDAQQWLEGYTRAVEIHERDWQELNELHTEAAASLLALHTMRDATLHRELHIDMPGPEELKKHPELVTELVTGIYRRFHESIDDDLESDDDEPVSWLDFSDDELADMDESLLMGIVTSSDDVLPLEVVRECASRGDAMVPLLRQHLENEAHWTEGVDESDWWGLLHAVYILGLIPGEPSARTLLHAFRKVNFDENNNLSDWLSACWPALCRNKTEFTTVPLRDIAENRGLGWYARSQAVDCVLADAADSGTDVLDHAVDWLAGMCGDDSEDADFRIVAGSTLLDFPRERHRPVMEALADLKPPASLFCDYTRDDIQQAFDEGDRPEWERFRDPWQFYDPDEIERRQARWLREAENREHYVPNRRVQTYRRESPKTGRNDPCPCGSGRKYKKCCLGATR